MAAARLPVFGPSGPLHAVGAVPDPGATAGATRYLREDGTWTVPSGTGGTITGGTIDGAIIGSTTPASVSATSFSISAANCAAETTVTTPCLLYAGSATAATSSGSSVNLPSPSGNAVYEVCGWVFPHNTSATSGNVLTVVSFTTPGGTSTANTEINLPYNATYDDATCKAVPVKASTTPTVQAISTVAGGTFAYDWMITVNRIN